MAVETTSVRAKSAIHPPVSPHRALKMVHRNFLAYQHYWIAFITGFFEPILYLVGVGYGVGQFIEKLPYQGTQVEYAVFIAPGLLATATLNGALFDGFFTPFFKLNWMKTYDGIITTPISITDIAMGEITWALMRGTIYGSAFILVILFLGLIESWWALLTLPAVMLSGAALSAGAMCLVGVTRQISSLDKVFTLIVLPLFLFSGTFYPITLYPGWVQPIVMATPLYNSAELLRNLTTGLVGTATVWHTLYLVAMFVIAGATAIRLMRRRLIS
jgi:lipooligosaccharide transport system permease protein